MNLAKIVNDKFQPIQSKKTPQQNNFKEVIGLQELSEWLSLTPQRVLQLTKEGLPKTNRNEYPLQACVRFYIDYLRKQNEIGSKGSLTQEKMRLYRAKAKKAELEVLSIEGSIMPIEEAKEQFFSLLSKVKTLFLDIPGKIAPVLDGKNSSFIKTQLEKSILLAFNQISEESKINFVFDITDSPSQNIEKTIPETSLNIEKV